MNRPFTWNDVYFMWNWVKDALGEELDLPPEVQIIPIEWNEEGTEFYGYDWIANRIAEERIDLIHSNLTEFFLSKPTSIKGTMHTAEILNQVQSAEDRAAIWIAATAYNLKDYRSPVGETCDEFFYAAISHLRQKSVPLWHHAMRSHVPAIHIADILPAYDETFDVPQKVMSCIAINTMLLRQTHKMLLYSSREEHRNKGFRILGGESNA